MKDFTHILFHLLHVHAQLLADNPYFFLNKTVDVKP